MDPITSSSDIRRQLGHPVIDGDGHWLEPVPVFLDFLRDEGGTTAIDAFERFNEQRALWYGKSPAERMSLRLTRPGFWGEPAETLDHSTAMLPGLMYERLEEFGIDFALIHPTLALALRSLPDDDVRAAALRASNQMNAEMFAPYADKMTPVAAIPMATPGEAIDEIVYSVNDLGFKAIMADGHITRCADDDPDRFYVDTFGLDSPHDYDPFFATCVDLGVAIASHDGSIEWLDRRSPNNYVFNHLGHFAFGQHANCRAYFLGGVTRRFSDLNFAFLEGGVGWACGLLLDLVEHWEKRNPVALRANLQPTNVDLTEFKRLWEQYAPDRLTGRFAEIVDSFSTFFPGMDATELTDREVDAFDDFAAAGIGSVDELRHEFRRNFYFGCEADDRMTAVAFDERLGTLLKPVFSSDVGHFDVTDMSAVLAEAWELVEDGLITEANFEEFTFGNAVDLHAGMNPEFFVGTVVEEAVASRRR